MSAARTLPHRVIGPAIAPRAPGPERLDASAGRLGMGRARDFPFPEWRDCDRYRTVFFDAGRGRAVVLVHGLGGNATHWQPIAGELAARHRVLGLDLVGSGWSAKPAFRYRVDLLRDHLLDFMDRRGVERATLVGHSLGGAVCLAAALAAPRRCDGLVLVGASGVAPLPAWMRLAAPAFLHRRVLTPFFRLGHGWILRHVFVDRPETNPHVRWFHDAALQDDPGTPHVADFARVCESLCRDAAAHHFADRLPELEAPVLALWGDADELTSLPAVLRHLGAIPRVRTVILHRCGHMPMIERPEETLFHVLRFLEKPP